MISYQDQRFSRADDPDLVGFEDFSSQEPDPGICHGVQSGSLDLANLLRFGAIKWAYFEYLMKIIILLITKRLDPTLDKFF